MKKKILLVLVLALGVKVVNADFTFGEPVNLGPPFNTPSGDGCFALSADGLEVYITSDRPGGLGYFDIWRSTRENADDPWGPLVNVQEINSRYNESFPCLSADGLTLYFSDYYNTNAAGDRPGGVGYHDLWMCTRPSTNDPWGPPVNMGATVNSPNGELLPSVSQDGQILIFASKNRPGGVGDWDLWMSTRPAAEGDWAAPVNMGPAVNSSAYDGDGCLSTDGLALFFSSGRSGGMGWYDMWMTTRPSQAAAWSPPVNLGPAINTSSIEGAPSLSPDQKTLYFASNQPGGIGGFDLYEVPIVPIVDLNSDGIVDAADMCIIVDYWGTDEPLCDIGPTAWGDGIVDVQDLIVLAEHLFEDYRIVANWKLDETEGDIAYNSIGDNHGIISGNPTWQPDSGQVAGTLEFDGIGDYVTTDFVLNPSLGRFSAFTWIKGGTPGQVIISQSDGTGTGETWLGMDALSGNLMTGLVPPPVGRFIPQPLGSQTVITDGLWHHIGFVWDGSYRSLYVDGVEVAKDTAALSYLISCNGGLNIGADKDLDTASFFSGLIDDIRIYDVALTPEQIEALAH